MIRKTLPLGKPLQLLELLGIFTVGGVAILIGTATFGTDTVASIGSIWAANLLMLAAIYAGLRYRGQRWSHLGLHLGVPGWKSISIVVLKSLPVFAAAILAFAAGAVLMAILLGRPESADMSKYNYLQGNLAMTVVALGSVYVVSAFAEELIYRGFLITRVRELAQDEKSVRGFAVVFSSLVFGLIHSDWGLAGMVQATCMGLALGASYLFVRRNLWVLILAHAYMDTILVLQMYFGPA